MSWQLPPAPLLGRVLATQLAGLAVAGAAALVVATFVPTSHVYPLKAALVFAAIAAFALGRIGEHHPFDAFGSANTVTTTRAALVCLVAALIGEARSEATSWTVASLTVLTTALDGVDGWLARRSDMSSTFGARYDMELDALLILLLAVIAWQHEKAGPWVVLAGAMRYAFVAASYIWPWLEAPLPPSVRRQAVCVVQIVGLAVVVSPLIVAPASTALAAVTLATLTWSFGVDVLWLRRHGV